MYDASEEPTDQLPVSNGEATDAADEQSAGATSLADVIPAVCPAAMSARSTSGVALGAEEPT